MPKHSKKRKKPQFFTNGVVISVLMIAVLTSFMFAALLAIILGQGLGYFAALPEYALNKKTAHAELIPIGTLSDEALIQNLESTILATKEEQKPENDHEESIRVSSLLYRTGTMIYVEVNSRRDTTVGNAPWKSTLWASHTTITGYGPGGADSKYIQYIDIPSDAVQIQPGGQRVSLSLDLKDIPNVTILRSGFSGSGFTDDLSILPGTIFNMTWDIGAATNRLYGGRIRTTYDRPDGGRSQSDDSLEYKDAQSLGTVLGSLVSGFFLNRSEYVHGTHEVGKSPENLIPPAVVFPPDPTLPPEP